MLAPTLLVGLGGKGSEIVTKVAELATEEQRKNISFVVFDTDVNELRQIREDHPDVKVIQTSTKLSVGEYLNIDRHARDVWFPVNKILSRKTLTEGAGQVRAISRLALDTAIRAGNMEPLHQAIEDLYKLSGEKMEQALKVIIVSSLAGGTGSGLILPVSMYIKNFLKVRFQKSANIMRGFFVLPEVFYEVIKGQSERNNLKCNAYATLRELDAFMMKGDGTLPEKYRDLKFEMPRVGSKTCDEYDVMPFDFCFLFDAQNVDGKKLNSFNDYLRHAANCIYAQAISPMSKRSNSSEDNVIRELCLNEGRNRYCGAGSSLLRYPFEDIKKYIAKNWAKDCVSKQWLEIDNDFKKLLKQTQNMREVGLNVGQTERGKHYIDSVNFGVTNNKAFDIVISNSCLNFDEEGTTVLSKKWEEYLENLNNFVLETATVSQENIDFENKQCEDLFAIIRQENPDEDAYTQLYLQIIKFQGMVVKRTEQTSKTMAYQLFEVSSEIGRGNDKHVLETYLKDISGNIIHPNAIRYFLYMVYDELKKELTTVKDEVKQIRNYWENFEKRVLGSGKDDEATSILDFIGSKMRKNLISAVLRLKNKDAVQFVDHCSKLHTNVKNYRIKAVYEVVLTSAIRYVEGLSNAFHGFYNTFEKSVEKMENEVEMIYNRYSNDTGHTIRYVSSSKKCLDKYLNKCQNTGNFLDLPGELCAGIYGQIRKYAMLEEKPKGDTFFVNVFENSIMSYFEESVMKNYGQVIDIDVLTALENEAEYEKDISDLDRKRQYSAEIIGATNHLAQPFIEAPIGEQREPIRSCAYSTELDKNADLRRKQFIDELLKNEGGCADSGIDKYMIVFYRSIYGLRANGFSKFAPPLKDLTYEHDGGEYYKAYFELVSQIKPESHKTAVITPHIDKNWHLVSVLPDLDEGNQVMQERKIFEALLFALITEKINWTRVATDRYYYMLDGDENLVVSNHTPCDNLYEVLDALTINPLIVNEIINDTRDSIRCELLSKIEINKSMIVKKLEKFKLIEFGSNKLSIFDVPYLYKKSKPTAEYLERESIDMLETFLDIFSDYYANFFIKEEHNYQFGAFVLSQYEIFLQNIAAESKSSKAKVTDTLVEKIKRIVVSTLKENGLSEKAEAIEE
ncbi:MAG: tubulin-like doman-containing protein [bacterium]